jgi:hypothetical protein
MRRSLRSKAGLGPSLGLAAALLAACGSSSTGERIATKPPQQIIAASRAAAEGAATVHVLGTIAGAGGPLSLDLQLVGGKGGQGRIAQGGLDLRLVRVGEFVYVKGNATFYRRLGDGVKRALADNWLKARTRGGLKPFATLTNLSYLVDMTLTSHGTLARNGTRTVDGQRALAIDDPSTGATIYVSADGNHYPVEVRERGGGKVVFDRWNQPVNLAAPTDAVNVKQLNAP